MELTHRLTLAISAFEKSSSRWAAAITFLTVAVVVFTIALVLIESLRH